MGPLQIAIKAAPPQIQREYHHSFARIGARLAKVTVSLGINNGSVHTLESERVHSIHKLAIGAQRGCLRNVDIDYLLALP
jgi:hypothetical protein